MLKCDTEVIIWMNKVSSWQSSALSCVTWECHEQVSMLLAARQAKNYEESKRYTHFLPSAFRRNGWRYCFERCLSVDRTGGGGTPSASHNTIILPSTGPMPGQDGVPPAPSGLYRGTPMGLGGGTSPWRQSSRVSTWCVAGGMPLAFTQEDFLLWNLFSRHILKISILNNFKWDYHT